jgi:hypothetical protein
MPNARTTDPDTSHEAAQSVWEPSVVQSHILEVLRNYEAVTGDADGLTDDDIFRGFIAESRQSGWVIPTPQSVRSRRAELARDGHVVFSGIFGLTASGRRTQKWRAAS